MRAFSMPTILSLVAWKISSARLSWRRFSAGAWVIRSSTNSLRTVNVRPASVTVATPSRLIVSSESPNRCCTCCGSNGALRVATAMHSGIFSAASRTAAPPRLWPIRILGASCSRAQEGGGGHQVGDVGGETGVAEIARRVAEAGEVEAQHRDAALREAGRDALGREHVLGAGEAMGEQPERPRPAHRAGRAVPPAGRHWRRETRSLSDRIITASRITAAGGV